MIDINKLFFELIRIALGNADSLSHKPSDKEWKQLYDSAKKQSLVGICFAAVQRLPEDERPPEMLYLTWMGMAAKILQRNEVMNASTKKALELFRKDGFECTTLKGQGIAKLYKPLVSDVSNVSDLQNLRQSGDIDLWVQGGRKKLYDYSLKTFGKLEGLTYHHIHFPIWDDVEIEAHTWPSFLTNPIYNRRFQKFCMQYTPQCSNGSSGSNGSRMLNSSQSIEQIEQPKALNYSDTLCLAFNRVFILQHCFGHFCGHGVGFRQLLDYYFVLKQGFTEEERWESMRWINKLGMGRFAAALMWLCVEVFGMDKSLCISEPNEKYGRFLLAEVMMTGNMGHQDERVDHKKLQSALGRYLHNIERDWKTMRIAPGYALWEPFWGIFQFVWCRWTKYKYGK